MAQLNHVIDDGSHTLGQAQQKGMCYNQRGQGRRNIMLWKQEIGGEYGNHLTLAIYYTVILESFAMEIVIGQDAGQGTTYSDLGQGWWCCTLWGLGIVSE